MGYNRRVTEVIAHIRLALRVLAKNKGVSLAIIATLALAIGANTAVFTVTSALLLKPLPYQQPQRLVLLDALHKDDGGPYGFTLNRLELFRARVRTLSGIAAAVSESMGLSGVGDPVQVSVNRVTGNFFTVLGITPQLGRAFTDADADPGAAPTVIISDSLWRSRFGGDRNVLGKTVDLDAVPYTIIGVLPANVRFPFLSPSDIFSPRYFEMTLFSTERLRKGVGYLTAVGRLADNASISSARAELEDLHRQYTATYPDAPDAGDGYRLAVNELQSATVGDFRGRVLLLLAAVALVLAIACANVAGLLLSRAVARRTEMAIRTALGAGRAVIIRQLLLESVLLACFGGIAGLLLSVIATRYFAATAAELLPSFSFGLDWRVLVFAATVTILTGLLFGIAPAWRLSRPDLNQVLRVEGTGSTSAREHRWSRDALVIAQAALSLVLLVGAGLLLHSFRNLLHEDAGFEPTHIVTMNISLPTSRYKEAPKQVAFFDELLRRLSATPEVQSAAISSTVPLVTKRVTPMLPEGQPEVPLPQRPFIDIEMVSPRWFQTLGVALRQGRDFNDADNATAPKVVIVNESFARRFWPGGDWIGKHIAIGRLTPSQVIAVAADVKNNGMAAAPTPQVYVPYAQISWSDMNLIVRTRGEPEAAIASIKQQVNALDAEQPIGAIKTGEELLAGSRSQLRFTMLLMSGFSALGLTLCAIGLYAMLAYSIARRHRELAIRMALGASARDIFRSVVLQGVTLVAIGIAVGLAIAFASARVMSSLLYKVPMRDVGIFALAPAVLLIIAALATYLAARRARTVSPLEALRTN